MKDPYQKIIHQLKRKLKSEHLSDAIRTTVCIFFPAILFFALGQKGYAIASGTGALLIAATDGPNTLKGKIRSAVENLVLFAISSILICYSFSNLPLSALVLLIVTFLCAIIACYGQRYALSGTMSTALCIFVIGLRPAQPLEFILGVLSGGAFYYAMSIFHQLLLPFRSLEQAISECLKATSGFVKAKADCYDPLIPLAQAQSKTILEHIKVSEKQQLIRILLLSENPAKMQRSEEARRLFRLCITIIDLYQQFSASHHNYQKIRTQLQGSGTLATILQLIHLQSSIIAQLDDQQTLASLSHEFQAGIQQLKHQSNQLDSTQQQLSSAILDNLTSNHQMITELFATEESNSEIAKSETSLVDYQNFISPPPLTLATLFAQFDLKNPVFRFSLRLALLITVSYVLAEAFQLSRYTYWLLLTILVVARPKLALTFKRNSQRLIGTTIGIIVSIGLLLLTSNPLILLPLAGMLITAFFYYARLNYLVAVAVLTPSILIGLALLDENWQLMFAQRFLFTLIGCILALLAAYLFPIWETGRIKELLIQSYTTAIAYLKASLLAQSEDPSAMTQLRLARKENYLATAELSQAMGMINIEPHAKALDIAVLGELQASAYQFSSIISSVAAERFFTTTESQQAIKILQGSGDQVSATLQQLKPAIELKPLITVRPNTNSILIALWEVGLQVSAQLEKSKIED